MPDIAMCTDRWCPSRGECYRYRAVPTLGWQTYQFFPRDAGDAAWRVRAMAARDHARDRRLGWPGHLVIWVVVAIAFVIPAALHGLDAPAAPVTPASSAAPAQGPGVGAGADGGRHFDWLGLVVSLAMAVVSLAGTVGFCVMYVAGIKAAAAAAQAEALAAKARAEAAHEAIAANQRYDSPDKENT